MPRIRTFLVALTAAVSLGIAAPHRAPWALAHEKAQPPSLLGTLRPQDPSDVMAGAISPDGKSFVFEKSDHGNSKLWLFDMASRKSHVLTPRAGSRREPVWSYDGTQIAYEGEIAVPGFKEPIEGIWALNLADGREHLVYSAEVVSSPTWTRDGGIVFAENIMSLDSMLDVLREADARTGATRLLFPRPVSMENPSISPDGHRVAYLGAGCGPDGKWGLGVVTLDAQGGEPGAIRCLDKGAVLETPLWSSGGEALYALDSSAGDRHKNIVMLDIATGHRQVLGDSGANLDIRRISVTRDDRVTIAARAGLLRVGLVPASGGIPVLLQQDTTLMTGMPLWSSDGSVVGARATSPEYWRYDSEQTSFVTLAVAARRGTPGTIERHDSPNDSLGQMAVSPDGKCAVDERDYGSRDSLAKIRSAPITPIQFTQAPRSYGKTGVSSEMRVFGAATQWNASGTRVIKQAWGKLYLVARDTSQSAGTACSAVGGPHRIELRGFTGVPTGWRLSPDGGMIAFSRVRTVDQDAGVFIVPTQGGNVRTLRALRHDDSFGGPDWSADGKSLYFADADTAGTYRILRLTISNGAVDTITRGPRSALHPRLSPDGQTLAVTVADLYTNIWQLDRTRATDTSVQRAVPEPNVRAPAAVPEPHLLDLARRIAASSRELQRVWPNYWVPTQAYGLYLKSPRPGMLLVAPEAPMLGFREVVAGVGSRAPLHVYWRPGPIENVDGLQVPVATIDSLPAPNISAPAVARWRERVLFSLFFGEDELGLGLDGERWDPPIYREKPRAVQFGACMSGLPSSCNAVRRAERRALTAALTASPSDLRAAVERYVALRWVRTHTSRDDSWASERLDGIRGYAANRAAALVAEGDTAAFARNAIAAFSRRPLSEADEPSDDLTRWRAVGQVLAILLDRLGADWKPQVTQGDGFLDALVRAVHFDSTAALRIAKQAYRTFDLSSQLEATRVPSDTSQQTRRSLAFANYDQHLYYALLARAIANDSIPLAVALPMPRNGTIDSTRFHIRYVPGAGDSATNPVGLVMLPNPESFVLEGNGFRIEVHHVPVMIDPRPGVLTQTHIVFFLPDSLLSRVREQNLRQPSEQRLHAPGVELWLGPTTSVDRTTLYRGRVLVSPAPGPK